MSKILRNLNRNKRHCEYLLKPLEKIGASKVFFMTSYHGVLLSNHLLIILFKRRPFFFSSSSSVMQSNILKSFIFEKSILRRGWGPLLASFLCILPTYIENPPGSIYLSGKQRVLESTYTYLYHTNIGFWASWLHIIHSL